MAITVSTQSRKFVYDGKELTDPGLHLSPKDVQDFYSSKYPELTNAAIKKERDGEAFKYEFKTKLAENG